MRKFLALLLAALGLTGCYYPTPADQEALQYVAAIEIPVESREDKTALAKLLSSLASSHQDLHVDDHSRRTAEAEDTDALGLDQRLIPIMTIWRGDEDDQLVGSVSDLTNRRKVWATFNKGPKPEMETPFREAALEMIIKRWPDANALPVLPGGSLPLPRDLVMTGQGYRIDRSRAEDYSLSPDSDLLTN